MKLTVAVILIFGLQISAKVHSQSVTLTIQDAPLDRIFLEIEQKTAYRVIFNDDVIPKNKTFSINAKNEDVKDVLTNLLKTTPLTYKIIQDDLLVIINKTSIQEILISGRVVDEDGEALVGVSVKEKGTTTGTVTDVNGNFQITVTGESSVLVFNYIGFKIEEVTVGDKRTLNVTLRGSTTALNEVVVVGYGSQSRKDVTGAISTIKPEDLESTPVTSVDALLQGRAAGVQVTTNSGAPGGGVSVRIRGNTSISSGNDPLYVIDGIPVVSDDLSGGSGLSTNGQINALADINPNDIESIQVLKDASATSIYGARAANGVVLITTKRGSRGGQTRFSFNNYAGMVQAPRKLPLLNGEEAKTLFLERRYNAAENAAVNFPQLLDNPSRNDFETYNNNTDWQDAVLRSSLMQNYSIGMQGGDQSTRYAISLGYLEQQGHIIETKFNRITSRINIDYDASKKLRFGNSLAFTRSKTNLMDQSTGTNIQGFSDPNPYFSALVKSPFLPVFEQDRAGNNTGEYFGLVRDFQDVINPVGVARQLTNDAFNNRLLGNLFGEYDILGALKFRSSISVDYFNLKEKRFVPAANREAGSQNTQEFNWINENTLNYSKLFSEKHNFSALAGLSFQESRRERLRSRGQNSPSDLLSDLNSAPVLVDGFSNAETWGISSLFGRVTYSYDDKYLFTGNIRRDGSSRFGANNKFAVFPSASIGWRVSAEPFMQKVELVNDLKIRASYGTTGNQNIGNYRSLVLYSGGANYLGNGGISPSNVGVPDLSWESTNQANLGLDVTLFNNRVTLITDYYVKKTKDLLLSVPLPGTAGFGSSLQNFGDVENKGWEFAALTKVLTGGFKWNVDVNIGTNRNKILRLPGGDPIIRNYLGLFGIAQEGEAIGTFYGWNMLGVYARDEDNIARDAQGNTLLESDGVTPRRIRNNSANGPAFAGGDVIFEDINHDGIINDDDRVVIGKAFPDFFGGINNSLSFKNWDLNVFLQFSKGNDVINGTRRSLEQMSNSYNSTVNTLRRWRKQGDVTDVPKAISGDPMGNARQSTRWVEDGSYFRFKTVTLGYNIPTNIMGGRALFRNAKVYVTGQNLLTFTNYLGIDPEVNALRDPLLAGIDIGTYPQSRTFIFGLNLGF